VLDHQHRVSRRHQPVQHVQQLAHVVEVQAGRGLVEQVERLAGVALGELARQLDALGLAARQRGRRLPERDVPQADVVERLQDPAQRAVVLEQPQRL
jgi:hypothetical protein